MRDTCPVCDEFYNHRVDNGYRNSWPIHASKIVVCTPHDSEEMYVHVRIENTDTDR